MTEFTITIPKNLPSGQYLIRGEHVCKLTDLEESVFFSNESSQIALHAASSYGGAQFYISCAQVNVVNGGNGSPGPLVSIPGVYTGVRLDDLEWNLCLHLLSTNQALCSTFTASRPISPGTQLVRPSL